jgi:nitroreductase
MSNIIEDLNWRYATKQFDAEKKISAEDVATLLTATQLSASSFGMQPYKILHVKNAAIREQLKPASWNQTQITDASDMLVFCAFNEVTEQHVDEFIANTATTRGMNVADLAPYAGMIKQSLGHLKSIGANADSFWAEKQAYLAVGNLLAAAANLKIDACPMEGFDANAYNEILGLTDKNLRACVVVTLGYRHADDKYAGLPKVRKTIADLFVEI